MRMSEAEYTELMQRPQYRDKLAASQRAVSQQRASTTFPPHVPQVSKPARHVPGVMNKTELAFAATLEDEKREGLILAYWFEKLTLKLANDCRYTPDFLVLCADGSFEFREVKGFWREDARIKIKVAAEMFAPFRFIAVQKLSKKDGGGWKIERF